MARPLLNALFPSLAEIRQPLGGEYAARRELLEVLPFVEGWGVELGLLIDVADRFGVEAIAEADLGVREHRNRDLEALAPQAMAVLLTGLRRAGVAPVDVASTLVRVDDAGTSTLVPVPVRERPPMVTVAAYQTKFGRELRSVAPRAHPTRLDRRLLDEERGPPVRLTRLEDAVGEHEQLGGAVHGQLLASVGARLPDDDGAVRHAELARPVEHAADDLPGEAARVEPPLTGDDERRVVERLLQPGFQRDDLEAGFEVRAERGEPARQSPGRAAPFEGRHVDAGAPLVDVGEALEAPAEQRDLRVARALLGPEARCGVEEADGHVARHGETERAERPAEGLERRERRRRSTRSHRPRGASARRRPAPRPRSARPCRAWTCAERIVAPDQREAARLRHLDHGQPARRDAVLGVDRVAERAGDPRPTTAATVREQRVEGALAAIGERDDADLLEAGGPHPPRHRLGGVGWR